MEDINVSEGAVICSRAYLCDVRRKTNSRRLDDTIISQHVLGCCENILGEQESNSAPLGR